MRTALTFRFESDYRMLDKNGRAATKNVLSGLAAALTKPTLHQQLGLRQVHASGIWVARVGLGLRLVFARTGDDVVMLSVGMRKGMRRFLNRGF